MLINFIDAKGNSTLVDTANGPIAFAQGGTPTLTFNGNAIFSAGLPSASLWGYIQAAVYFAARYAPEAPLVFNGYNNGVSITTTAAPAAGASNFTLNGFGFQQGCSVYVDYLWSSASSTPITSLGSVVFVDSSTLTIVTWPVLTAGTYPITLVNPDGTYFVGSIAVS